MGTLFCFVIMSSITLNVYIAYWKADKCCFFLIFSLHAKQRCQVVPLYSHCFHGGLHIYPMCLIVSNCSHLIEWANDCSVFLKGWAQITAWPKHRNGIS